MVVVVDNVGEEVEGAIEAAAGVVVVEVGVLIEGASGEVECESSAPEVACGFVDAEPAAWLIDDGERGVAGEVVVEGVEVQEVRCVEECGGDEWAEGGVAVEFVVDLGVGGEGERVLCGDGGESEGVRRVLRRGIGAFDGVAEAGVGEFGGEAVAERVAE